MNTLPDAVADVFLQAAITALQELVQVAAIPEADIPQSESSPAVIATIELPRAQPGRLSLVLSQSTAASLAARYLPPGTEVTAEMVNDVAGEFANVIAGLAKTMFKGTPYHFRLSTPCVRSAPSLSESLSQESNRALRLSTELGAVWLSIDIPECASA
jgi:CheY-specific phosphatase CheX